MSKPTIEAVDSKLFDQARETLKRAQFVTRAGDGGGTVEVTVIERSGTWTVTADREWVLEPTCTCHDFWARARWGYGPWCRHVVAVLVRQEELRCQLLDLLM